MKPYKKYGLEDKSYTNYWLDNLELNSGGLARQKINYSYCRGISQPWQVPQLYYQGSVYTYWKGQQGQVEVNPVGLKIARKHLENIRYRLEQRLKSAKAKGDRELLFLLEREREQSLT